MIKQSKNYRDDYDRLQSEAEKKFKKRERKERPKMKVSGAGVKKLGKIIRDKAH